MNGIALVEDAEIVQLIGEKHTYERHSSVVFFKTVFQ